MKHIDYECDSAISAAQQLLYEFKILSPSQMIRLLRLRGFSNTVRQITVKTMIRAYSYGEHGYVKTSKSVAPKPELEKAIEVYLALPGEKDGMIYKDSYPIQLTFLKEGNLYSIVILDETDADSAASAIKFFDMQSKLDSDAEFNIDSRRFFVVVNDVKQIQNLGMEKIPCTFIEAKFALKKASVTLQLENDLKFFKL